MVHKVHVVIGAMLDAAIDDGHIAVNVARKRRTVKAPTGKQIRAQRAEVETWTAAELRAFLAWDRDVFNDDLHKFWHLFARRDAYLFGDSNGRLRWPDEVSARWAVRIRLARKALGEDALPHVTIKGLRHTHATLLLELETHPKVVQERLGHSDISTKMNIYSHVTPTMQRGGRIGSRSRFDGCCCKSRCIRRLRASRSWEKPDQGGLVLCGA